MKATIRVPFAPDYRCVVVKTFSYNGKTFTAGQRFPWAKLGCDERKARQLWELRFLNCEAPRGGSGREKEETEPKGTASN